MASRVNCIPRLLSQLNKLSQITAVRLASSKTLSEAPEVTRFGVLKAMMVAVPCILVGGKVAKDGAQWLEENEIFIPEDDDDD